MRITTRSRYDALRKGLTSIATTSRYLSTNVKMKRDVLNAFWRRAGLTRKPTGRWRPTPTLLAFLSSL
jgi:hypothetical protein